MTHLSTTIICLEHRALSAMLRCITLLLSENRRKGTLPDFDALQAMLFYVGEFPEKLHHPKESRLLFPPGCAGESHGRMRCSNALKATFACGEQTIRELEHAPIGFRIMSDTEQCQARRDEFERLMKRYVDAYLDHMHVEEAEILPLAESVLSAEEWAELDAAFLMNRDPLAGYEAVEAYRPLFKKIVGALQNSGNVGSVLEALAGAVSHCPSQPAQNQRVTHAPEIKGPP